MTDLEIKLVEALKKTVNYAIPMNENDSTGQEMVKMRRAWIEQVRTLLNNIPHT